MLATTLMTTLLLPLAGAAPAPPDCVAASDATAHQLPGNPSLYVREYRSLGQTHVELWKETNGVAGLQPDPSWNCGSDADQLLDAACYGCAMAIV